MKIIKTLLKYTVTAVFLVSFSYLVYFMVTIGLTNVTIYFTASFTVNSLVALAIFSQTRVDSSKLSWILITIIIPIIGIVLFLIFGGRYRNRKTLDEYHKKKTFKFEHTEEHLVSEDLQLVKIFQHQSKLMNRGVYSSEIQLYDVGNDSFKQFFIDLKSAKKTIWLNYYIMKSGEIFSELKNILLSKVKEGVDVKVIIDDFGVWNLPSHEIRQMKSQGIKIAQFGKVQFPFLGANTNHRSHRKFAIIDSELLHTGGINIADEYANYNKKYGMWLDYSVRITGKILWSFILLFIDDWEYTTKEIIDPEKFLITTSVGNSSCILVEETPEIITPIWTNSLSKWIYEANSSIKISTPYLAPSEQLINALKHASMTGVDVEIFIPGTGETPGIHFANRYYASILNKYGVKIYETNNMFLHSKIGVFDNKFGFFGSANIDRRSSYLQNENNMLVTGEIISDMTNLFDKYKTMSKVIPHDQYSDFSMWKRFKVVLVRLFTPIL